MRTLVNWFKARRFRFIHYVLWAYIYFMLMWPKIPFKTIEYTYIAIRYEDFFLAFVVLVFVVDLFRRKVTITDNPLLKWIPLYWTVVFVSFLYGFYYLMTVKTLELGFLHAARRVEYMIIFFIAYAVVENKEQFMFYVKNLFVALFIVCAYAVGQKFLGWPAYLTMNPAYARGLALRLTEDARIASMFGGHYDLAAYLVIMIPLTISALFNSGKKYFFALYILALLVISYTVSRVSFGAYVMSTAAFILYSRKFKFFAVFLATSILLLALSDDLTTRFLRTVRVKQIIVDNRTGEVFVPQKITPDDLPAGTLYVPLKQDKSGKETKEVTDLRKELIAQSTVAATIKEPVITPGQIAPIITTRPTSRPVLDPQDLQVVNSLLYDISSATRFQVEWPRAINAFGVNPLLGTGPSSLTEATDNDYLRALGEVGLLGFSLFFFIILKIHWLIYTKMKQVSIPGKFLYTGLLFATFGLFINASYIDIFEASKVAFFIWFLWGLFLKSTTFSTHSFDKLSV